MQMVAICDNHPFSVRNAMSDAKPSEGTAVNYGLLSGRFGLWARVISILCLALVLVYVGIAALSTIHETQVVLLQTQDRTLASSGLKALSHKVLAEKFTDKQGRMLADPPANPEQWINPDTLIVAHIQGADETPGNSWSEWEAQLAQITGKKVVDQTYTNSVEQIAAATAGKVVLLALHAADTPFLVNNYGFQPLAVLGNKSGINGNRLDIIVPPDSPIQNPANLRGHRLVCTVPSSITGYRAAVAVLLHDQGLRANVDYELIWSLSQKNTLNGFVKKEYQAAAVSDEKLQSYLAKGKIEKSQFKIIYQSPVIPRTTIGCFYNLNTTLAEQLRQAILAPAATVPQATTSPDTEEDDVLNFLPVDYKRDFQFVRDIDDQFDPRFDAQKNAHAE